MLTAPAWLLIGQLCMFHVQLQREGLTTYAYIVREQKRTKEPARPSCCARMTARLCNSAESVATRNPNSPHTPGGNGAPAAASQSTAVGGEQGSTYATESQRRGSLDR